MTAAARASRAFGSFTWRNINASLERIWRTGEVVKLLIDRGREDKIHF